MKNIAVLVHSLVSEYSIDVLHGITNYFQNKDVRLFICQTRNPIHTTDDFDYSNWGGAELISSKQIDAIILITGSYLSVVDREFLEQHLRIFNDIPIVSIGTELDGANTYCVKVECKSTYYDIVKHLKERHGCKTFAFMSSRLTDLVEGEERLEAYIEALKANDLNFDESLIYDGRLTTSSAIEALEKAFTDKKDVPFDAILCANDSMALGVEQYLQKIGVSIPDDVKIIGYDETTFARDARPKISTIDQNVIWQGEKTAEFVLKLLNGECSERTELFSVRPIYRQSCGCIALDDKRDVYLDGEFKECFQTESENLYFNQSKKMFNFRSAIDDLHTLFDMTNTVFTLRKIFYTLKYLMLNTRMSAMAVAFFEEPLMLKLNSTVILPERIRLSMIIDNETDEVVYEPGCYYSTKDFLLPNKIFEDKKGNYIVQPIYSSNKYYGYFVCKLKEVEFVYYAVFLKILVNTLAQSYEYNKKINENEQLKLNNTNLSKETKTDELTSLLNRRGIMEVGQKSLDIAAESNGFGLVLFADMDNLKKINDTYGHQIGDAAIKAMAEVLTRSLRANDAVGRISGDEFAVIAVGMKMETLDVIRKKMKHNCKKVSKENKFPFLLSFSVGAVEFSKEHTELSELLTLADDSLYREKKVKHAKDKKFVKKSRF